MKYDGFVNNIFIFIIFSATRTFGYSEEAVGDQQYDLELCYDLKH